MIQESRRMRGILQMEDVDVQNEANRADQEFRQRSRSKGDRLQASPSAQPELKFNNFRAPASAAAAGDYSGSQQYASQPQRIQAQNFEPIRAQSPIQQLKGGSYGSSGVQ